MKLREQRSSSLERRASGAAILPSDLSEDSWKELGTRFRAQFPTKSVLYPGATISPQHASIWPLVN